MLISSLGTVFLIISIFAFLSVILISFLKNKLKYSKHLKILSLIGCVSIIVSFIILEIAFLQHNFAIEYVAKNGSLHTPTLFTFAGVWASLEGSLLLWIAIMAILFIIFILKTSNKDILKYSLPFLAFLLAFFTLMIVIAANPFKLSAVIPKDGLGPNPLLRENPLMATHPPILYAGYVAMFFPWAISIAFLISTKTKNVLKTTLIRDVIRWYSLLAFTLLSAGVLLGAWWSYEVLGWGGYWAWDPVENASIIPWIFSVICIHATTMNTKKSHSQNSIHWFVFLAGIGSILGTFLTRSGIVASVHAFSVSSIGSWLLSLLALSIFFGMYCLITAKSDAKFVKLNWGSRDKLYLLSFAVLTAGATIMIVGTLFPLISSQLLNQDVSVGAPYFDTISRPLSVVLLIILGLGNLSSWKNISLKKLFENKYIQYATWISCLFYLFSIVVLKPEPWVSLISTSAIFAILSTSFRVYSKILSKKTLKKAISQLGMLAHIGFSLLCIFVLISSTYSYRKEITLTKNTPLKSLGYTITLKNIKKNTYPDHVQYVANISLKNNKENFKVNPYITSYKSRNMTVGGPSIISNFSQDFYTHISSAPNIKNKITVIIQKKYAVIWVWYSGLFIVLGGLYATYRRRGLSDSNKQILEVI